MARAAIRTKTVHRVKERIRMGLFAKNVDLDPLVEARLVGADTKAKQHVAKDSRE